MRNLVFFVNDASWLEHNRVGIAGINDPAVAGGSQANSSRQKAIAELAGISAGCSADLPSLKTEPLVSGGATCGSQAIAQSRIRLLEKLSKPRGY